MTTRPRTPDPIPPDVDEVLTALDVDDRTRDALRTEIASIPRDRWATIEPWPYRVGVPGPLRLADGNLFHGAATRRIGSGVDLLVAISGWPVERMRCPRPLPGGSGATSPLNPWLHSRHGFDLTLAGRRHQGGLRSMPGGDAALMRVAAGFRPAAYLSSCEEATVDAWLTAARRCRLATHVDAGPCTCGEPGLWVEVARRERLDELFPLDALATWWRGAIGKTDPVRAQRAACDVRALSGQRPSDHVGRFDEFIGRFCAEHWLVGDPGPWTRGLLLGEWPPTTAAAVIQAVTERHGHLDLFPASTGIRRRIVHLVPALDLDELGDMLAEAG